MKRPRMTRRGALAATLSGAAIGLGYSRTGIRSAMAASPTRYDFQSRSIADWAVVAGQWAVEDLPGDPGPALVQRATKNEFNVIAAPAGPFADLEVSMRFKPISGREDASGGVVFRFAEGRYYVVRANALEGNFRLYTYDRGRREIASANVAAPALGQWHTVRIAATGERIQGWLDDKPLIDHRDRRFAAGKVGLWTKADSVTAFRDVVITPAA
ncbi:MAG: DUF1080 domain-containing protein [Proteobacteria bacterium]|nr:DUF1080 domain-containing protein [Pseudomonadota bacterium]MBI3498608.1 DUF1080 domain-containing protein [Pseudomonadota bacterium]